MPRRMILFSLCFQMEGGCKIIDHKVPYFASLPSNGIEYKMCRFGKTSFSILFIVLRVADSMMRVASSGSLNPYVQFRMWSGPCVNTVLHWTLKPPGHCVLAAYTFRCTVLSNIIGPNLLIHSSPCPRPPTMLLYCSIYHLLSRPLSLEWINNNNAVLRQYRL